MTIIVTNLHLLFISTFDLHVSQTKYMDHGKGTNTMVGFLFFCFVFLGGGGVATSGYKLLFMACLIHFERMCAKKFFFSFCL